MKRIAAFVFAFLAIWYLQASDADAQFRRECRYGFCGGGGGPSGTPISNACINSSGSTVTFTAQGVGVANPSRVSVVSINWSDSTAAATAELTAMTIGGITMTRAIRASGDDQNSNSEIWYVANPTGTSANVVATFSTAVDGVTIEVYRLVGYYLVPLAGTTGTTSVSQGYTNKQLAIAAGSRTTNVSTSLSNMTNDYSSACGSGLWGVHASKSLSGNGTLTSAISPTSSNPKIALVVWATQSTNVCTESTAFIARTSGMDATHQAAYGAYICGLVADGVWSSFDVLRIYATQNITISLLNLVSTNYPASLSVPAPAFTVDRGYLGVDAGTVFINSGFNALTAGGQYTQNSAHISTWSNTNAASSVSGGVAIGVSQSPTQSAGIYPKYNDGNAYFRINSNSALGNDFVANANSTGHYLANRSASNATQGYKNGSSVLTNSNASTAMSSGTFYDLGQNAFSTIAGGGYQITMSSIGRSLTSTQVSNFYVRTRTYMTAVGVP